MSMVRVTYEDNGGEDKQLHITQRNMRGGALGDVVVLDVGEEAEVTLETDGVQLTIEKIPRGSVPTPEVEA